MTLGFISSTVFASFFEWTFHRLVMHRKCRVFTYPYQRHTLVHHRHFRADATYHLSDPDMAHTVPMAWWNGPALILSAQVPFLIIAWMLGQWGFLAGSFLSCCAYYGAYEYMHWCMHVPRRRNVERSGIFFRLNGHHLLHHRYMNKNFNVVFPLADLLLGTLLLRSKVHFAQARGPSIPDVQPRPAMV